MPKRTSDYHAALRHRLKDPQIAASYLRAAMEESRDQFFVALRNVAQARQMTSVAKKSRLNRESLYKMLSSTGNPTYDSLNSVLGTMGLRLAVEPRSHRFPSSGSRRRNKTS
jgi:probable addiction module antidote protein